MSAAPSPEGKTDRQTAQVLLQTSLGGSGEVILNAPQVRSTFVFKPHVSSTQKGQS